MRVFYLLAALIAALCSNAVFAADYPSRPVRIVVTYPPGGTADIVARVFGKELTKMWKKQVIVDNRVGAGGVVGTQVAYQAAPDGYTLLMMSTTHVINKVLIRHLKFDLAEDFHALAVVAQAPAIIAVHPTIPAHNLKELTAMFKAAPGKYNYTACNIASPFQFAMEMYKHKLGIEALHVPHRGCVPALTDALAGRIKILATTAPLILPYIKQGKLTPIALLSKERSPSNPSIPTARESGIPELKDFYVQVYYGFMTTRGPPAPIVEKLEADLLKAAAEPDLRKRLEGAGLDMLVLDSKAMMDLIRRDIQTYARVAKQAGIKSPY